MKISFVSYLGLSLSIIETLIVADENFFLAVSPIPKAENWTLVHQRSGLFHDIPEGDDTTLKNEICRSILENPFIRDKFHVHPIRGNRSEIIKNGSLVKIPEDIVGPYTLREMSLNRVISHNYMFSCLSWNYELQKFVKFYISRQFTFEHPYHIHTSFAPFRLIFKQSTKGELVAKAIAEKPAEVVTQRPTFKRIEAKAIGEVGDGICALTTAMRIRLCTIILSAAKYRQEGVIPSYTYDNDEPRCESSEIYFTSSERSYREYNIYVNTVECKAMKKNRVDINNTWDTLIFQGVNPHTIFTTQTFGGVIYPLNELHI